MVTAFVLIMTKTGKEKEVISQLQGISGIKEAWAVYGDYDIIAKASVQSLDDLNSLLLKEIRNTQNISMTSTLIGL
jgi:anthranilate phosphoribosyltransferase